MKNYIVKQNEIFQNGLPVGFLTGERVSQKYRDMGMSNTFVAIMKDGSKIDGSMFAYQKDFVNYIKAL